MKVKIQNRFAVFPFLCMASVFLFLIFYTSAENKELKIKLIKADPVFFAVTWVISFILSLVRTTAVTVERGAVRIKYPIGEKALNASNITGLYIYAGAATGAVKTGGRYAAPSRRYHMTTAGKCIPPGSMTTPRRTVTPVCTMTGYRYTAYTAA